MYWLYSKKEKGSSTVCLCYFPFCISWCEMNALLFRFSPSTEDMIPSWSFSLKYTLQPKSTHTLACMLRSKLLNTTIENLKHKHTHTFIYTYTYIYILHVRWLQRTTQRNWWIRGLKAWRHHWRWKSPPLICSFLSYRIYIIIAFLY